MKRLLTVGARVGSTMAVLMPLSRNLRAVRRATEPNSPHIDA